MPGIGNPNKVNNPFAGIKKAQTQAPQKNKRNNNVGKELNRLAGREEEAKFVDREQHNKMDKNSFLRLLSNQLANQDPFKPVDQKKFAADMAQFAQLEQMTNINTKLEQNSVNKESQDKYMAASFIGKSVRTEGTSIPYDGAKTAVDLPFFLEKPAAKVMVRIFDEGNNLVGQIEKDSMGAGSNSVTWDGRQLDGVRATKENYRFEVRAYDDQMQSFMGKTMSEGTVTGVSFENGETVLVVDGTKKVYLRDVNSFSLPKTTKQNIPAATNSHLKKHADAAYNKVDQTTL